MIKWLACILLVPPMFIGVLMIIGMMIDGIVENRMEYDLCLKHATNGYEIQRCR